MKSTILVMLALAVAAPSWAQDEGDAPDQGVARISLINGNVGVRHGDAAEETAAALNAPLLTGDRLSTDNAGRAEVQFDYANMIRVGPMSEVRMGELADRRYEVQLAAGTMMIRVERDNEARFEISTPSVSVRPSRRGSYRISILPDGVTEVTVRSGETEISTPRGSEVVRAGQTLQARGDPADPEFQTVNAAPEDDFDRWSAGRDREMDRSVSYRYVPSDVYGTESLDNYGSWDYDAPYGYVWVPRQDAGWAPYRDGRWSYVDYYGWSWISADPWGWAPYHYGRWYHGGRGWAWYPGAIGPRYYWHPALVSFFGWGGGGVGVGVGFGFGNVGWVPLAPFERYRPWYGRGFAGGRNVIVNNVNVINTYRNARFTGGINGVTSVRAGEFGRGGVRSNNFVRAGEGDLRNVGDVRGSLPFNATQEGRRFSDRNVDTRNFPKAADNQRFFRSSTPQSGNPNVGGNRGQAGGQGPTFRGGAVEQGNGGGFRRAEGAGQPPVNGGGAVGNNPGASPRGNNGGGWRRFDPSNGGAVGAGGNPSANGGDRGGFRGGAPRQVNPAPGGNPERGNQRGWTPQPQGSPAQDRGVRGGGAMPQQSQPRFNAAPQAPRPVQISPPMVRERGNVGGGMRPAPSGGGHPGGGGAPQSRGGGGGGGGQRGGGSQGGGGHHR